MRAERKDKRETLVSERQDGPQLPLRPYIFPYITKPINVSEFMDTLTHGAGLRRKGHGKGCTDTALTWACQRRGHEQDLDR